MEGTTVLVESNGRNSGFKNMQSAHARSIIVGCGHLTWQKLASSNKEQQECLSSLVTLGFPELRAI